MAGPTGLQQLLRMQGLEWGDSGRGGGDSHLWIDGGGLNSDMPTALAFQMSGKMSNFGSMHTVNLTFTGLTQDYAGIINGFDSIVTTDTSAFNYTAGGSGGALRATVGHVNIQSVGATVAEACALDGLVVPASTATGTLTLGFGCVGQIQNTDSALDVTTFSGVSGQAFQAGTGTFTQANGTVGTVQTTAGKTGNITHGYGGEFSANHNSTSTFTEAFGLRTRVTITGAGVIGSAPIACEAFVQTSSSGSVTANNAIGVRGRVLWGSTTNITSIYGVDGACTVSAASTVSQVTAVRAESPSISGGGAATFAWGVRIADQSGAGIGTAFGLQIDNQATSGATAIKTLGGIHTFITTANRVGAWSLTDGTTTLYNVDTRNTIVGLIGHTFAPPAVSFTAAAGATYSAVAIPAFTLSTVGATGITAINGLTLNIGAPTISSGGASATAIASTVYIAGAPINSGSGSITDAYALHVAGGMSAFGGAIIAGHAPAAINSTNTATAAQAATGYITSTSAAPTTITLPTGTALGAALGAVQGTIHYLTVDNTAGASTVTVAVAVNGILSADAVANAGSAGLLTIPNGVTGQGTFMLMFSSATAYTFSRIA